MKQVIEAFKRNVAERRIPVLKLEIDYELVTLHDAMIEKDIEQINKSKERLEEMRQELLRLEA